MIRCPFNEKFNSRKVKITTEHRALLPRCFLLIEHKLTRNRSVLKKFGKFQYKHFLSIFFRNESESVIYL